MSDRLAPLSPAELRRIVDLMAARGITELRLRQGDQLVEIGLQPGLNAVAAPLPQPRKATGPGIFYPWHPAGDASLPCLQAGDFLFPLSDAPLAEHIELLAAAGAVVGFGTPLWQDQSTGGWT